VTFNGMNLIDGTYASANITLQVGAQAGQTFSINLADMRASALGQVASKTGAVVTTDALVGGSLTINGQAIGASATDGVSTSFGSASAIAKAAVINEQSGVTGVTATVIASTAVGDTSTIDEGAAIANGGLTINGVNVGAVTVLVNDSDSALRDAINAVSNQTGVVASLNTSNQLTLTAEDGRNITLGGTGGTNLIQSLGFADGEQDDTFTGQILLSSDRGIQLGGASESFIGFGNDEAIAINANTAINNISVVSASRAGQAISAIDNALRQVSTARSGIGAATNRLESTVSNLQTLSENLTASESRIRDADFATETANLTKAQILQQAGTAILAQANLTPQAALSLIGG
jgi:flagellin